MQGTYNYTPETNSGFIVHNVAPIPSLKFMLRAMSFPIFCPFFIQSVHYKTVGTTYVVEPKILH